MRSSKYILGFGLVMIMVALFFIYFPELERQVRESLGLAPTDESTITESEAIDQIVPTAVQTETVEPTPRPTIALVTYKSRIRAAMAKAQVRDGCKVVTEPSQWALDLSQTGEPVDWPQLAVISEWRDAGGAICGVNVTMVFDDSAKAILRMKLALHSDEVQNAKTGNFEDPNSGKEFTSTTKCEPDGWCTTTNLIALNRNLIGGDKDVVVLVMVGNKGYAPGSLRPESDVEMEAYWGSYANNLIWKLMGN